MTTSDTDYRLGYERIVAWIQSIIDALFVKTSDGTAEHNRLSAGSGGDAVRIAFAAAIVFAPSNCSATRTIARWPSQPQANAFAGSAVTSNAAINADRIMCLPHT